MMEAIHFYEISVLTRSHMASSQKTAFFIVTTMETSNLTYSTLFQPYNGKNNIPEANLKTHHKGD
jgi:hypothetical protein